MASYLLHALTTFVALAPFVRRLGVEAKHDGRSHRYIQARRDITNDPAPEPGFLSATGGPYPNLPPTSMPHASASISNMSPIAVTTYSFLTTVIQIPIATDTPSSSAIFPLLSDPLATPTSTFANSAYNNATDPLIAAQSHLIIPLNATTLLANGSTTTFLSQTTSTVTLVSATASPIAVQHPAARIIFGDNGCQTLYSITTTALCSTTVSIGGHLPIPVTDCSQLVTFSTSTVANAPSACTTGSQLAGLGLGGETVYFAAPWYEIAARRVPKSVEVVNCVSGMEGMSCHRKGEMEC